MTYILAPNQIAEIYPYSIGALRRDNPNVSFPRNPSEELLADWNVFPVVSQTPPEHDPLTQNLNQATPVLADGQWLQAWEVTEASAEEVIERERQQAELREAELKQLLMETDYVGLSDYPKDKSDIVVFRQAWREELDGVQETLRALAPVATKD